MKEEDSDIILFNKIFTEYQSRFLRFASTYVSDQMAAEDIVMESMMYYWENRSKIKNNNIPTTYVYILTCVRSKCLNYLRHQNYAQAASKEIQKHEEWVRSIQITTLEACNPEELLSKEVQDEVHRALENLPETTRRIFTMRHFEEKSYLEIATIMNMSTKGVEYHISKATQSLRKSLKHLLPMMIYVLF